MGGVVVTIADMLKRVTANEVTNPVVCFALIWTYTIYCCYCRLCVIFYCSVLQFGGRPSPFASCSSARSMVPVSLASLPTLLTTLPLSCDSVTIGLGRKHGATMVDPGVYTNRG